MNVQELESQALSVPERAKLIKITTAAEYIVAGELLKTVKGLRAEIDATFDPIISKAHDAHKEALAQKRKVDDIAGTKQLTMQDYGAVLREG